MKPFKYKTSDNWYGNIHVGYHPDNRKKYSPRSSGTTDRGEARIILERLQGIAHEAMKTEQAKVDRERFEEMVSGVLRACGKEVAPPAPSWSQFSQETVERQCKDVGTGTAQNYRAKRNQFERFLTQHRELSPQTRIDHFTTSHIQEYYDWTLDTEKLKTSSASVAITSLSMIFERAVAVRFITFNPCQGIKKRLSEKSGRKPFSVSDLAKITQCLAEKADRIPHADEWQLAIRFAIFTGARAGDCCNRSRGDFSEDFTRVEFVPQKKERFHRQGKDVTERLILPPPLAQAIKHWFDGRDDDRMTPHLIPHPNKRGAKFREIMDLAGVEYETTTPESGRGSTQYSKTMHSLRHTLKTELRAAGVSDRSSDYMTGHDSKASADRYIHERPETVYAECEPVFEVIAKAIG